MRITESRLRHIIRQEARSLHENALANLGIPGLTTYKDLVKMFGKDEAEQIAYQLMGGIPPALQKLMKPKGRRKKTPKVLGKGPMVKLAQTALDMYYDDEHPDDVIDFMISKTARRAPGSRDVVSDRSDEILELIMAVDPIAGKKLKKTLSGYVFMG